VFYSETDNRQSSLRHKATGWWKMEMPTFFESRKRDMANSRNRYLSTNRKENEQYSANEKGWKNWGDHPVPVVIGTIAAIISIIVVLLGSRV
jgi:hypothetical protein